MLQRGMTASGGGVFGEFGSSMAACTTAEDVGALVREEVARHGYTASAGRAFMPSDQERRFEFFFRDCPKGWADLADTRKFAARSFLLTEARRRLTPFTWLEAMEGRALSASEREVWDAAIAWGWTNGFVVPIHGPAGYFACVGMDSPERDLDLGLDRRLHLQMIATLAHERCHALTSDTPSDGLFEAMSARELECLRWVAAGKTDWEIGAILSISATTVKFHVDSARRKLGARNRAQAAALLVLNGLY